MAVKTAVVRTRVEPKLKREASKILNKLGLSESEGVRLLLKSLVLHNGLPYELKVPNAKTRQAMKDAENGNTSGPFNSVEELLEELKK
jgi:DNA-damage-inducible protein J